MLQAPSWVHHSLKHKRQLGPRAYLTDGPHGIKLDGDELAEAGGIIVSHRFRVPERLQDRVGLSGGRGHENSPLDISISQVSSSHGGTLLETQEHDGEQGVWKSANARVHDAKASRARGKRNAATTRRGATRVFIRP